MLRYNASKPHVPYSYLLASGQSKERFYVLSDVQVTALIEAIKVLRYKVTWIDELLDNGFYEYVTSPEKWDIVEKFVDELEISLMPVDAEIGQSLSDIADAISAIARCLCAQQTQNRIEDVLETIKDSGIDITPFDSLPESPVTGLTQCELANTIFGFWYQWITEEFLPLVDKLTDFTLGVVAISNVLTLISGGVGLPVSVVLTIITIVLNLLEDVAFAQLINAMLEDGQDIVCAFYNHPEDLTVVRGVINQMDMAASNRGLLAFLLTGYGRKAVLSGIVLGKINPAHYQMYDCDDCQEQQDYLYLDGHYQVGDFAGNGVEDGFVKASWPTWLETRNIVVDDGYYDVMISFKYAPMTTFTMKVLHDGFPARQYTVENFQNVPSTVTFHNVLLENRQDLRLSFQPSIVVYWATVNPI